MFKTQQLKPYKRWKHNICSFQKVHKHSLMQNELVSTFTFKKTLSIYISFINHLYRNSEKIYSHYKKKRKLLNEFLWCKKY